MLTDRDKQIIKHLEENGPTDLKTLWDTYFIGKSHQLVWSRLKTLESRGHIKSRKGPDDRFTIFYKE